ncbi:phosphotransferase family protein [Nitratireductor alexandrii]|uniref:phosphotransferase family protein n=1 Tax=Nitratireductor alexandrii TaxID=2448161 RepID=UPI000FDC12B2|nr:phosphotransferase family protein [Nitratireductor alexandrii]
MSAGQPDTAPVETRNAIDTARLESWMIDHVPGFTGPLQVDQFVGGQSNPTFLLRSGAGNYVLRRRPPGNLLPSAHAVDREHRVLSALHVAGYAVPRPFALCLDETVIGSIFFVMSAVEGRVFWNQQLPDLDRADRRPVFQSLAETLAALHAFDPDALGLSDFGPPGNYYARQIGRWTKQYRLSQSGEVAAFEKLIDWLPGSIPDQTRTTVVHGDFQLHNTILHPTAPRVAAVIDWELSTLGDPLADLSYMLMQWHVSGGRQVGLGGADLDALGIPGQDEMVETYCRAAGRSDAPKLDWHLAYNTFRFACILQGIAGRVREGNAASPRAREAAARAPALAETAWRLAERAGASG